MIHVDGIVARIAAALRQPNPDALILRTGPPQGEIQGIDFGRHLGQALDVDLRGLLEFRALHEGLKKVHRMSEKTGEVCLCLSLSL